MRLLTLALCLFCLAASVGLQAGTYVFRPSDPDLGDLPHEYYHSWGINWSVPTGQTIVEATLFIDNINDWTNEANDRLYIHLLDNPPVGIRAYYDNQGGGDAWASHPAIATYTDTNSYTVDLTYRFSELGLIDDLTNFASNGVFGLGFDADCHYYNSGICLTVQTGSLQTAVPEPISMVLGSLGLGAVAGAGRLRRRH